MSNQIAFAQHGQQFSLGRGKDFFGIWRSGARKPVLVERWPETPDGWYGAWVRFNVLEQHPELAAPAPVTTSRGLGLALWPISLLAAGIFCGVVGLFPDYLANSALASHADQLVPHVLYFVTWLVAAALLAGPATARGGALLGLGVSALSLGFFLTDAATAITGGGNSPGAGFVLGLVGWLLCSAGVVVAISLSRAGAGIGRPQRRHPHELFPVGVLSIGVAIAFAAAWDHYLLHSTANGQTTSLTLGNAFSNPGVIIAGNVITMALMIGVPLLAAFWRPVRDGAYLLGGALVVLLGQVAAALIGAAGTPASTTFGISAAEANRLGLSISSGLTPAFWIYMGFVLGLVVLCAAQTLGFPPPDDAADPAPSMDPAPLDQPSMDYSPLSQWPVPQPPVDQSPVQQSPVQQSPVQQSPVQQSPVQQSSVQSPFPPSPLQPSPATPPFTDTSPYSG